MLARYRLKGITIAWRLGEGGANEKGEGARESDISSIPIRWVVDKLGPIFRTRVCTATPIRHTLSWLGSAVVN